MSRFDFSDKLNFSEVDLTPAEKIIEHIGRDFSKATRNVIHVGIEPYAGKIAQRTPNFATSVAELFQIASSTHTIQSQLGRRGDAVNQFEIFLYTPSCPEYRFRMLFIRYGVANYPVEIILEQGMADACFRGKNSPVLNSVEPIISLDSRDDLETFIESMLQSEYILKVMQELIRVDQLHRYRKKQELMDKIFTSPESAKHSSDKEV